MQGGNGPVLTCILFSFAKVLFRKNVSNIDVVVELCVRRGLCLMGSVS